MILDEEIEIKRRIKNLEWILTDLDTKILDSHYFDRVHMGNDREIMKTKESNKLKEQREKAFFEICQLKGELEDAERDKI